MTVSLSSLYVSDDVASVAKEVISGELKKSCSTEVSNSLMWVDKYKPKNLKQIIGQHGEASNVNKYDNL